MIGMLFDYAGDIVEVRLDGANLYFRTGTSGGYAPIEGIKLSYEGTTKEHPDLKANPEWKTIAIQRLKDKIRGFRTEQEAIDYIRKELEAVGYKALAQQQNGFRVKKL